MRLYTLHLSRHVKGMVKGPVTTEAPKGTLFDIEPHTNALVVPNKAAVTECLPACYRKAFDRAGLSQLSGREGFHWTLRSSRGQYLNTLYAVPYDTPHRVLLHLNGQRVKIGDQVISSNGEEAKVTGWAHNSRNRVYVKWVDGGTEGEYFVSVFDMKWEDQQ